MPPISWAPTLVSPWASLGHSFAFESWSRIPGRCPGPRFKLPRSQVSVPKSYITGPKTELPDFRSQVPAAKLEDPGSKVQPCGRSQVPDPRCQVPDPMFQVPNPNPYPWPQSQIRVPPPKCQVSNAKSKVPGPSSQITGPRSLKPQDKSVICLTQLSCHPFHCVTRDGRGLAFAFRNFRAS